MAIRLFRAALLVLPLLFAAPGCTSFSTRMPVARREAPQQNASPHSIRLMQLARRYEKQGNAEGALRIYRRLQKSEPNHPDVQRRIAAITGDAVESPAAEAVAQPRTLTASARAVRDAEPEQAPQQRRQSARTAAELPAADAKSADVAHPVEPATVAARTEPRDEAVGHAAVDANGMPAWAGSTEAAAPIAAIEASVPEWARSAADRTERKTWVDESRELASNPFADPVELPYASAADRSRQQPAHVAATDIPQAPATYTSATPALSSLGRAQAAWRFYEETGHTEQVVAVLRSLLYEEDPDVVELSAFLLGKMGTDAEAAVGDLTRLRDSSGGATRIHAAEALTRISAHDIPSVAVLVDGLLRGDADSRWLCALTLTGVAPEHRVLAVNALTLALNDVDPTVRSAAALSLGGFGPAARAAIPELRQTAEDHVQDVRLAAATALACIDR